MSDAQKTCEGSTAAAAGRSISIVKTPAQVDFYSGDLLLKEPFICV